MSRPLRMVFCCFAISMSLVGVGAVFGTGDVSNTTESLTWNDMNHVNLNQNVKQSGEYDFAISVVKKERQDIDYTHPMDENQKNTLVGRIVEYNADEKSIAFIEAGMDQVEDIKLGRTSSLLTTLLKNDLLDKFTITIDKYAGSDAEGNAKIIAIVTGAEQIDEEEITFSHAVDLTGEMVVIKGDCRWENKETSQLVDSVIIMKDLYLGDVNVTDDDHGAAVHITNTLMKAENIYTDTSRLIWNEGSIINISGMIKNHNYLYLDCAENVEVEKLKIVNEANCYVVNKESERRNEALKNVDFINHKYLRLGWGLVINSLQNVDEGYFETYSQTSKDTEDIIYDIVVKQQLITTDKQAEYIPLEMEVGTDTEKEKSYVILPVFNVNGSLNEFKVKNV